MTIIGLLVILVVAGVALYLIRMIPMDPTISKIITAVFILVLVLWLLESLGLLGGAFGRPIHFLR